MSDDNGARLSVLIPTTRGWPAVRPTMDALREQAQAVDAEVVVLDGSENPQPPAEVLWPGVMWESHPGLSVFQLRPRGYRRVSGDIVAVTEDHCRPKPDWLSGVLRTHAEHPEAAAVGGAVENGTPDHILDWATFFVTQAPFMAPLTEGAAERITGGANLSYKRRALRRLSSHRGVGSLEFLHNHLLRQGGDTLVVDDSLVVEHDQSMGFRRTSASNFHNGRTIAGMRRQRMAAGDWVRVGAASVMPLYRSLRTIRTLLGKRQPPARLAAAAPLVVWFQYCQGLGELVGYAAGPGDSPGKLL
ncbi:hypothetical protein BH20CHL6_BH20CHL6_04630 [soil metagenome]